MVDLTKHTKGPWQVSGSRGLSSEYKGHGVGPDGSDYVVVVPYNSKDHLECLANAHLIAAAPLLLTARDVYRDGLLAAWEILGDVEAKENGNRGLSKPRLKELFEKGRIAVAMARQEKTR